MALEHLICLTKVIEKKKFKKKSLLNNMDLRSVTREKLFMARVNHNR